MLYDVTGRHYSPSSFFRMTPWEKGEGMPLMAVQRKLEPLPEKITPAQAEAIREAARNLIEGMKIAEEILKENPQILEKYRSLGR